MAREDLHFSKLKSEIRTALNKASSRNLLGSGALCRILCSLLLDAVKEYAEDEYTYTLNTIKSGKTHTPTITDFSSKVENEIKNIIQKHQDILDKEIRNNLRGNKNEEIERILQKLDFGTNAKNIFNSISHKYEADYSDYLEQKKTNNRSRWIFWIGLGTLVVSCISLYITYIK